MTAQDGERRPEVALLGYEQARDELLEVVRALEGGGVPLEESLALWERGEALAARCQEWLDGARQRLAEARAGTAGRGPAGGSAAGDAGGVAGGDGAPTAGGEPADG